MKDIAIISKNYAACQLGSLKNNEFYTRKKLIILEMYLGGRYAKVSLLEHQSQDCLYHLLQ